MGKIYPPIAHSIVDLKDVIRGEDLSVDFFANEATAIAMELGKEYSDFGYINEKIRHLSELRVLACRASIKGKRSMKVGFPSYDDPEVKDCIRKLE